MDQSNLRTRSDSGIPYVPAFPHASWRVATIRRAARLPLQRALSKHLPLKFPEQQFDRMFPVVRSFTLAAVPLTYSALSLQQDGNALCDQSCQYVLAIPVNTFQQVEELHMRTLPDRMHFDGENAVPQDSS